MPAGNLDSKTNADVINLFKRLVKSGKTVVMVTHDNDLAAQGTRTITIADGEIESDISTQS
jgi:putative ABC transport system ATP-binding protein